MPPGGRRIGSDVFGDNGLPGLRPRAEMHHMGGQFDRAAIGVAGDMLDAVTHACCLA